MIRGALSDADFTVILRCWRPKAQELVDRAVDCTCPVQSSLAIEVPGVACV